MRTKDALKWGILAFAVCLATGCDDDRITCPDTVRPVAVTDLAATAISDSSVILSWKAPGDDGDQGKASRYDVRYSTAPDTSASWWESCERVADPPVPKAAGQPESLLVTDLAANTYYYFALKTVDDFSNWSDLSNVASCSTSVTSDAVPPGAVVDLDVVWAKSRSVTLSWTASGDDAYEGTASRYDLRYSTSNGTGDWWPAGTRVAVTAQPKQAGEKEIFLVTDLQPRSTYYFALKVADEASNWSDLSNIVTATTLLDVFPELTVQSSAFGIRRWQGWTMDTEHYEVPQGSHYEFSVSADASWYGGIITGYSYAWDLEDINTPETDPNGIGAWTPWSRTAPTIQASFTEPRDYFLYMKCKDDDGAMTLGTIHFSVVAHAATKNLCYIDDWRKYPQSSPTGEPLDDLVWQTMLRGYDYGEGWDNLVWDEWEAPIGEEIPSLEFLTRFKVVVWSVNDNRMISPSNKSAWFRMNYLETSNVLAVYLGSEIQNGQKGKVWAFGRGIVESTVLPSAGTQCEYPFAVYEEASPYGCYIRSRSFGYDYMHIRGDFSRYYPESGGARVNMFSGNEDRLTYACLDGDGVPVEGYTRPPAAELYPNLPARLEPDLTRPGAVSLLVFEVLEYPLPDSETQILFYDPQVEQETGLIPLYKYRAASSGSKAHGKYCGFRYIPRGTFDHGEIVYFFFPMFPMYDDQARATAKVVLTDWFGLPDPDGPASGK